MINKRDIVVFVSGAYTAVTEFEKGINIAKATAMAIRLWNLGYSPFCPHSNSANFEFFCKECDYDGFLAGCITMLKRCDCVLLLDNWKQSKGANAEMQVALNQSIPIFESIESLERFYNGR